MKHKISFLILILIQAGCAVELRDRTKEAQEVSELRVESEYTLPVPMVMSEQVILRYDRLVLKANSRLITQGLNVRFEVKELISEGAEILTFKPDQFAPLGENGRRGGNLEIIAEHATGSLDVVMQGEHGGKGSDGASPDESLRGSKGAEGRRALYQTLGAPFYTSICTERAKNGEPGGQGLQGYPGQGGFKGGDSGTALVKVGNGESFKVRFEKRPGQGGGGGVGGEGGPGGYGGEPGIETMPGYNGPPVRNYAVAGPQGAKGPQGNTGKSGPVGNIEKVCVQIGGGEIRCE